MTQTNVYIPDLWMTTFWRALKEYVQTGFREDVYDVQLGYPAEKDFVRLVPFQHSMIHFDVGDIENARLGFGDNVVDQVLDLDEQVIEEWEAHRHIVTLDVGVWASPESGGVTARLEIMEGLTRLFVGSAAYETCLEETDGIEILSFNGGRFVTDEINDQTVFRIVDMELRCRVYSRLKKTPIPYIDIITPHSDLVIDGTVVLDV